MEHTFQITEKLLDSLLEDQSTLLGIVRQEGFTYQSGEFIKPNPAVAQLRETQKLILTLSARYGLSPRDKQLLERDIKPEESSEDFTEFGDLNG